MKAETDKPMQANIQKSMLYLGGD